MSFSQLYTAVPNDVITAARWNNEFGNVYDNGLPNSLTATGTTNARNVTDRFGDVFSVKDFGAIGDGASSDQTAIAAAVAAAYSAGKSVFWPKGTYVTSATIPNFHDVRHRGKGIVTRGASTFYVDPSMHSGVTNNLYVATTGTDTNDGLSTSEPRLTTQSMGNVIYAYPYANVTWKVNIAAGTYNTTGVSFSAPFPSPNRVQFLGVTVSAGVQPTTIFQGTGSTSETGLYFQNNIRAQVSNINFKRFRVGASPDANELAGGIKADGRCELYTVNVWTDDCDQGIYLSNGSQARIEAGRHGYNSINGNGVQFIRHSHGTVGYNGSAADVTGATGTAFIGGSYGVMIQEYSMAHTDYCYFSTQTNAGVYITTGRVHSVSSTYLNNAIAIDARLNANVGDTTNTFTTCTEDIRIRSGARHAGVGVYSELLDLGPPVKEIDAVGATTQSATPVTILTRAFGAKELANRSAGFKWTGYFEVVGVANTKTVTVTLGATTLLTATIAAGTTDYKITVELINVTAASLQKCFTSILQNGVTPTLALNAAVAEDLTAAKTLTVTHQVTNVADLNRFGWGELEIQH